MLIEAQNVHSLGHLDSIDWTDAWQGGLNKKWMGMGRYINVIEDVIILFIIILLFFLEVE